MTERSLEPTLAIRRSRAGVPVGAALAVAVGAEGLVVIGGSRLVGPLGLALVLLASAAWASAAFDARTEQHPRLVVLAIAAAFTLAIAAAPRNSHDVWSYVMYGRTVSVHHASPYVHAPSEYRHDEFLDQVSAGWRQAKSVYGPLFTAVSAVLTRVAGASAIRARLAFQGLSTLAVVVTRGLDVAEQRGVEAGEPGTDGLHADLVGCPDRDLLGVVQP